MDTIRRISVTIPQGEKNDS